MAGEQESAEASSRAAPRVVTPSHPGGPSIAAVVVTRDCATSIDACLRSVADWADEIVVVDSGSTDGTRERVRRYTSRVLDAPYTSLTDLRGFACSQATSDWVLLLEPDDIVPAKLARALRRYAANYDADIILVPDRPLAYTPDTLPLVASPEKDARFFRREALVWRPGAPDLLDRERTLQFALPGDNPELALHHQSHDPESALLAVAADAVPQGIGRSFGVLPSLAAVLTLSALGFALIVQREAYATILLFAALALIVLYRPQWALFLLVIGLPAMVALAVLCGPLVSTLFQHARFTEHDVRMTQWALIGFAFGFMGFSMVKILIPGFYARQETRIPVRYGVIALSVGMVMSVVLVGGMVLTGFAAPHMGLAISTSINAWVNATLLFRRLRRDRIYTPGKGWGAFGLRLLLANLVLAGLAWWLAGSLDSWMHADSIARVVRMAKIVGLGAVVYFAVLWLCGMRLSHFRHAPEQEAMT